jgi:hypothetical protein
MGGCLQLVLRAENSVSFCSPKKSHFAHSPTPLFAVLERERGILV